MAAVINFDSCLSSNFAGRTQSFLIATNIAATICQDVYRMFICIA